MKLYVIDNTKRLKALKILYSDEITGVEGSFGKKQSFRMQLLRNVTVVNKLLMYKK